MRRHASPCNTSVMRTHTHNTHMLRLPPSHGACPQTKGLQAAYESATKSGDAGGDDGEAAALKSKVDRLIREKAEQQVCCLSGVVHSHGVVRGRWEAEPKHHGTLLCS
jgi:hypothetical protein